MKKRSCEKCGYKSEENRDKFGKTLCRICYYLAPAKKENFLDYASEKVPSSALESFRNYFNPGEKQKQAMVKKAIKGNQMSRAPFGYKIIGGKMVPAENYSEIEEIFEEFLGGDRSLRRIAEKHKLSVNGLKKILRNFVYIGKVKFNNQIFEGEHKPIISTTLFNRVQNRLEEKNIS